MPFTAVYDACVLYPSTLRDLLIRVAQAGLVHARWTDRILDEIFDAIRRNRPDLDVSKLARTRELMAGSLRDVLVVNYESLYPAGDCGSGTGEAGEGWARGLGGGSAQPRLIRRVTRQERPET